MTGNKIAEKRTDKNGKVVTRHVNPPKLGTSIPLPPPELAIPLSTGQTTVPHKVTGLQDLWNSNVISTTEYTMEDFDPRAVEEVDRLVATTEQKFALSHAIQTELNLMAECGSPTGFHNIAVFGKHVIPHQHGDIQPYVDGLHEMGFPNHDYLLRATDQERETAATLVSFVARAQNLPNSERIIEYGQHHDYTCLADRELAAFIAERPEAADDVLDIFATSRDAVPVELLKEMLAHEEKAFRDGVL